jgi:hypothetical protein
MAIFAALDAMNFVKAPMITHGRVGVDFSGLTNWYVKLNGIKKALKHIH